MRNLFLLFFFLPCFCFSQEELLRSWDDVWINGKLKVFGIKDLRCIDSVLGRADSICTPGMDVIGVGYAYSSSGIVSYPDADFTIYDTNYFSMDNINFVNQPKGIYVNFGTQILTSETTIDDVRKHLDIHEYLDSAEHIEEIAGKFLKVRQLEYTPKVNCTDGPYWIFDFFENKLVRMTFSPGGA